MAGSRTLLIVWMISTITVVLANSYLSRHAFGPKVHRSRRWASGEQFTSTADRLEAEKNEKLYRAEVPVVSGCHHNNTYTPTRQNISRIPSHDGYPNTPYQAGYQCRFVLNLPSSGFSFSSPQVTIGHTAESTQDSAEQSDWASQPPPNPTGLRPWDYAIIITGRLGYKLDFMCDVERYKKLGTNGTDYIVVTSKQLASGKARTLPAGHNRAIVDFCVSKYDQDSDASKRTGFEIAVTPGVYFWMCVMPSGRNYARYGNGSRTSSEELRQ